MYIQIIVSNIIRQHEELSEIIRNVYSSSTDTVQWVIERVTPEQYTVLHSIAVFHKSVQMCHVFCSLYSRP